MHFIVVFFFSSRRRHTRCSRDWSSDVCSSDLHFLAAKVRKRMELAAPIGKSEIGRLKRRKVAVRSFRPETKAPNRQLLVVSNGLFHEPGKLTQIEPGDFASLLKEIGLPLFG